MTSRRLVDQLRIWIVPVTNGSGQRLFEDVDDIGLTLNRTFPSGVVLLTYQPAAPHHQAPITLA